MNTIDLLILVLICFNLLLGAIRGAVWQILRIASIVLGIWSAVTYGREFLAMFPSSWGLDAGHGIILAQIVLFLSVYLVMFGITQIAKKIVDKVKLGSMDRTLGAGLGAAKGALFCCVILYLQFTPLNQIESIRDQLYGNEAQEIPASVGNKVFLAYMKERIDEVVPPTVSDRVGDIRDRIEDAPPLRGR